MMNNAVKTPDEVVENIRQFNIDLDRDADIVSSLRRFRRWYYIPELKLFGPNMYIGFEKNTSEIYNPGEGNGGDVVRLLKQWFDEISGNDAQWQELYNKLEILLGKFNKKPCKRIFIHIPKQDFYKNLKQPLKN